MNFQSCMQAFGLAFALDALASMSDGQCRVAVRDMPITFRAEADGRFCVMTADLGEVTDKGADVFLKEVFGAMFMNGLGPGRWFSAEEGSTKLQLNGRLDLEPLDGDAFVEAVDRFAALAYSWRETAAQWRAKCQQCQQGAAAAATGIRV